MNYWICICKEENDDCEDLNNWRWGWDDQSKYQDCFERAEIGDRILCYREKENSWYEFYLKDIAKDTGESFTLSGGKKLGINKEETSRNASTIIKQNPEKYYAFQKNDADQLKFVQATLTKSSKKQFELIKEDYYKIFLKDALEKIKEAHKNNYLSIFAGAGVSIDSKLPSWSKLIADIKTILGDSESKDDYLVTAEKFYIQLGKDVYYKKLQDFIPNNTNPNKLHDAIVTLNIKNIVTTNWDNLFEKAIEENGAYFDIIKEDKDMGFSTGYSKLLKMHGSLDKENIVFKESDYLNYSRNFPLIENYVKAIFSTDIVILIGYSLGDYNVKQIIAWLNNNDKVKPIYFIKTGEKFGDLEHEYYAKKNIQVLYLSELWNDKKSHSEQLSEFLETIKDENNKDNKEITPILPDEEIHPIQEMLIYFDYEKIKNEIDQIIKNNKTTDKEELKKAFLLYHTQQDLDSFETLKKLSKESFKHRDHAIWFISEFNRKNFVFLYSNKFFENNEEDKKRDEHREQLNNIDLEENYLRLPIDIRKNIKPLTQLELKLSENCLQVYELKDKIQKDYTIYKNGGFSINQNIEELCKVLEEVDQERIGLCIIYNDIFYQNALKALWIASAQLLLLQKECEKNNPQAEATKMPYKLFSYSVRYFKTEEIKSILNNFYQKNDFFVFDNQEQIKIIFQNISNLFNDSGMFKSYYSIWFNNFLIITSRIQLDQKIFENIIKIFCDKLEKSIISFNEYESMGYFITHQYHNKKEMDYKPLLSIISTYMCKIASKQFNGHDIMIQTNSNSFQNILKILKEKNITFKNDEYGDLIKDFTKSIPLGGFIETFCPFIIGLYHITDKDLQESISQILRNKIQTVSLKMIQTIDAPRELNALKGGPLDKISQELQEALNNIWPKNTVKSFCETLVKEHILTDQDLQDLEKKYRDAGL